MKKKTYAWAVLPVIALLAACGNTPASSPSGASSPEPTSASATPPASSSSTPAPASSSTTPEPSSSSVTPDPVVHLDGYAPVDKNAEVRDFDKRFDQIVDDFSGETLNGTTDGVRHEGFLRALVDSALPSFPKTTDGAIYKAASGTYEAMDFGANGIGFKIRVSRGTLKLANLRLELRGGDAFKTYPIQLAEARNSDNEALPELTNEFQDILINPGQTIEDEDTVYENVDGTASTTTVLGHILGFHLVANDVEVGAEIEIDQVFTFAGTNRVVLDDFNHDNAGDVPNAWWGGSASGFIVRRGVKLTGNKGYTTPALGNFTHIALSALGDSSAAKLVGLDAGGTTLATVNWSDLTAIENPIKPLVNGGYANYVVSLAKLAGNGVLDKVQIVSGSDFELSCVFVTSLEVPNLDLAYPHIKPTVVMDTFARNIASLNNDWDASAAIEANKEAGVTGFVSYAMGDQIKTEGGSLVLPAAPDYASVTIGYMATQLDLDAKYVVIAAKGDDLSNMRFKFRNKGSNKEVYFKDALAAEGVKTYGGTIASPYVDEGGFTHYVFDLSLNGLGVGDIFDLYYTGATGAEIESIYFARDDFNFTKLGSKAPDTTAAIDLAKYVWLGNIYVGTARFFGVELAAATENTTLESFRVELNKDTKWLNSGALIALDLEGNRLNKDTVIPKTGMTILFDLVASGFPTEGDGWAHLHVGDGFTGSITASKLIFGEMSFTKSFGGREAVNVNKVYAYVAGYDLDASYDYLAITLKATGTAMTYESFRVESPKGVVAYANNPATFVAKHADGTPVAAADVIPEDGETIYIDVAASAISIPAATGFHIHYADWGDPVGTLQIEDVTGISTFTPYNLINIENFR